ncbi:MAG: hypothetical protein WBN40_02075, partial [Pseudomonadales bacterium]
GEETSVLFTGKSLKLKEANPRERLIIGHLLRIHTFYSTFQQDALCQGGEKTGNFYPDLSVKVARKHVCWYFDQLKRDVVNQLAGDAAQASSRVSGSDEQVLGENNTDIIRTVCAALENARSRFNKLDSQQAQSDFLQQFFGELRTIGELAA